jgi:thiol-disulfide isomerase/thioredoxin
VGGLLAARSHGPAAPSAVSQRGVDFSGTDPVSGRRISVADYRGKPVVINVWGSWCSGCRDEARDLASFAAAHPEVQVLGVDLQDTTGGAKAFYRTYGWRHPSVFDPDGKIAFALGLQGTPTTYFLDAQHRLVTQIVGATNRAGFEQGLRAVTS